MHTFFQSILQSTFQIIIPAAHAAVTAAASTAYAATSSTAPAEPGITTVLGLDWRLFIAQLINFSIVVLILWKWVFGPLGKKLTERQEMVQRSIKQSKDIELKVAQAEQDRLAQMEAARKEASGIIDRAQTAAEKTKAGILAEAQSAAEKVIAQSRVRISEEHLKMAAELKEEAATLIVAATEQILKEKVDAKKDQQMIKDILKSL